ncbi:hypothetical protein PUN28_009867 [Cardiocondyla obscurior]|uniref:Folded gastrulation N-terminal domain-containing protein n=1 Tax=Cardiocondyla obscurior TaxID=286306 RepID=A0AAW2FN61_9HYME
MLSLRRRHSRWRVFSTLLFLGTICSGELASVRVPEETYSASSTTSKKKDIGFLSDYWQGWLLADTQSNFQPGLESSFTRRITPKSVFIAPELSACAEGYHADKMGRCMKSSIININATSYKDFFLERLKLVFGNSQASKNDQKKSTGPLQLNIPLVANINRHSANVESDETASTSKPIATSARNETYFTRAEEKTKPRETNQHQVKNVTTPGEEESTFFLDDSKADDAEKSPTTVSVAESIEETNDTSFSEIMDYKVPVDLKAQSNSSGVKRVNASDGVTAEESIPASEKRDSLTESPPALVLLISPTKSNVVDDPSSTQNDTVEQIAQTSNFTSHTTTKESVTVEAPDSTTLPPTKELTSLDEQRDNETYAEDELTPETSKPPNDSQETDFVYDEEEDDADYPYSTDVPDDEDSTEGEEILKHGEAGMTIPTRDNERYDRDRHQRQRNQTADLEKKMIDVDDQIIIRFNDSAPLENKDEADSNISSEVSIDGDFILETTLLDVNTERLLATTQSPNVTEKIKASEDDGKESFDKNPDVVPEVVFSQDSHGAAAANSYAHERIEQFSTKVENETNEELEAAPSSSESILYDSSEEDSVTDIRTINEKRSNVKGNPLQGSSQSTRIVESSSKRTTMNLDSAEDFVRFPDYMKQPQQSNYVRFPSNEANSIHSLSYKQNSRYSADDVGPYGGTTKSSVPVRQKPLYYLTASSWKLDRSQPDHIQTTAGERQNRRPDLMHFWSKLPLIRDPAVYSIYKDDEATNDDQKLSRERFFRGRSSRRLSPFTETSSGNRVPTHKERTSVSV